METEKPNVIGDDIPYRLAMRDITKYLQEENLRTNPGRGDVWVLTPARVFNKEQRRLNKELGLHTVNKGKRTHLNNQ